MLDMHYHNLPLVWSILATPRHPLVLALRHCMPHMLGGFRIYPPGVMQTYKMIPDQTPSSAGNAG